MVFLLFPPRSIFCWVKVARQQQDSKALQKRTRGTSRGVIHPRTYFTLVLEGGIIDRCHCSFCKREQNQRFRIKKKWDWNLSKNKPCCTSLYNPRHHLSVLLEQFSVGRGDGQSLRWLKHQRIDVSLVVLFAEHLADDAAQSKHKVDPPEKPTSLGLFGNLAGLYPTSWYWWRACCIFDAIAGRCSFCL